MANVIATLLTAPNTINIVDADNKGPQRHVYEELVAIQAGVDPALASPYLKADNVNTIPAHSASCVSGNFTITLAFPKYGVEVTTGNILFNAEMAAIQTLVDSALAGEIILEAYSSGDVAVDLTENLNDTVNSATLTSNGTSVTGVYATVTTANAGDLGADKLSTPVVTTPGTVNRASEAALAYFGVIVPTSDITPQGSTPSDGDYTLGGNPFSVSPGTRDALVREVQFSEDPTLAAWFRSTFKGLN